MPQSSNIRDYATINELTVLSNLESHNAELIKNGKSKEERFDRMYFTLMKVMEEYKDKRILIVTHSTAIMYLLCEWCSVSYDSDYKFDGKVFFDGRWKCCQTFKLEFDDDFTLRNVNIVEI